MDEIKDVGVVGFGVVGLDSRVLVEDVIGKASDRPGRHGIRARQRRGGYEPGAREARRDIALLFLKAYVDGTWQFLTNRVIAIKALRKYFGSDEPEIVDKTYDFFVARTFNKNPTPSIKAVESALVMIAERSPKERGRRANAFVEPTLIAELV
jgi:hypothetical protein